MKKLIVTMLFAISAFALMSGCSSNDSTPAPSTLTGTAATGAPIDGTVTVKDAKGVEKDIATGTDGSFTLDVAGMTPPYLLKIMPSSGPVLYSFASQNGQTVNLTPTTNLAMLLAAGKTDLDAMYAGWDGTAVTAAQVATAEGTVRANLVTQINAAGLDAAAFDLFTTAFTADSTGIDGVLDNITITVDSAAGTYTFDDGDGNTVFDETATPPAPPAPPAPGDAISIVTVSGSTHALNGAYSTGCYTTNGGSASVKEDLTITGTTWFYTNTEYADAACSASPTESTITGALVAGSNLDIIGWYDGSGSPATAAPDAADGSGPITATAFTPLTLTISAATGSFAGIPAGTENPFFYIVDDTAAKAILYRDNSFDSGDLNAGIFDPYTQL